MKSYLKIIGFLITLVLHASSMRPAPRMPEFAAPSIDYGQSYPDLYSKYSANDSSVSVFKPESELCCSGSVFPSSPNSYHRCCGSSQFDTTRQKCCDGVVHDLRPGFDCCGTAYFSIKEAKCCISPLDSKEILKEFPPSILGDANAIHSTMCCGLKLYNTKTHICCSANRVKTHDFMNAQFLPKPPMNNMGGPPMGNMDGPRVGRDLPGASPLSIYNPPSNVMNFGTGPLMNTRRFIIFEKKYQSTGCCKGRIYDKSQSTCEVPEYPIYQTQGHTSVYIKPNFPKPPTMDRCNLQDFNIKTHLCCSYSLRNNSYFKVINKLQEKKWPNTACCGGETYDYETQICCNNKIHQQNEDGSLECCADDVFDVKNQQCCETSNLIIDAESTKEGNDSCCGIEKIPYNSKKQTCCGNRVHDLPEKKGNIRSFFSCCWDESGNSEPSLFNPMTEVCCGGVKHDNKRRMGTCCGSQYYNWANQLCCGGEVLNKTEMGSEACCGNKLHDLTTHLCCDFAAGIVIPKKTGYESCCGTTPYDYKNEMCCTNFNYPRAYPAMPEMPMQQTESAVIPRESSSTSCCGLNAIDLNTHVCCGSTPIESSKELCCRYIDEKQQLQSIALPKTLPNARCCGKDVFDPSTERCCNKTVVPAKDGAFECCGSSLYNEEKQICCNGKVHDLDNEKKNAGCCGENLYDLSSQVCCKGAIKDVGNTALPTECCYPLED